VLRCCGRLDAVTVLDASRGGGFPGRKSCLDAQRGRPPANFPKASGSSDCFPLEQGCAAALDPCDPERRRRLRRGGRRDVLRGAGRRIDSTNYRGPSSGRATFLPLRPGPGGQPPARARRPSGPCSRLQGRAQLGHASTRRKAPRAHRPSGLPQRPVPGRPAQAQAQDQRRDGHEDRREGRRAASSRRARAAPPLEQRPAQRLEGVRGPARARPPGAAPWAAPPRIEDAETRKVSASTAHATGSPRLSRMTKDAERMPMAM
jgi:hypothetical protein